MRAFLTGGTGFIGGTVARQLRERGDEVVALVRSPDKARSLEQLGCELAAGDLTSQEAIANSVQGCDAAFHLAAMYKVGITEAECRKMHESNVGGTELVLDAAIDAGVRKIVYVSTVNYFGNTRGRVVSETYERTPGEFLSCYDETKYLAHRVAADRIQKGAPVAIACPGGVYGPDDPSELGNFISRVRVGKLPMKMFPQLGFNLAHVDDIAGGIILVHDKAAVGETYVLGGQIATVGELIEAVALLSGHKPPRMTLPAPIIRMSVPFAPIVTKLMGLPPNLREVVRASDGVTYWASDEKARQELGYAPRDLETGLKAMLAAT